MQVHKMVVAQVRRFVAQVLKFLFRMFVAAELQSNRVPVKILVIDLPVRILVFGFGVTVTVKVSVNSSQLSLRWDFGSGLLNLSLVS